MISGGPSQGASHALKKSVLVYEQAWVKWKAEKCLAYEKAPASGIASKIKQRREVKATSKLLLAKPYLPAKDLNMHKGAAGLHQALRAPIDVKPALPQSISTLMVPILRDLDPSQGIEDEYKHKHQQLYSWRALRAIADVDINNFAAAGQS